jgi:hypothetical protein
LIKKAIFAPELFVLLSKSRSYVKHANKDLDDLLTLLEVLEDNRVEIEFGAETDTIYFTENHLADLKVLLFAT